MDPHWTSCLTQTSCFTWTSCFTEFLVFSLIVNGNQFRTRTSQSFWPSCLDVCVCRVVPDPRETLVMPVCLDRRYVQPWFCFSLETDNSCLDYCSGLGPRCRTFSSCWRFRWAGGLSLSAAEYKTQSRRAKPQSEWWTALMRFCFIWEEPTLSLSCCDSRIKKKYSPSCFMRRTETEVNIYLSSLSSSGGHREE